MRILINCILIFLFSCSTKNVADKKTIIANITSSEFFESDKTDFSINFKNQIVSVKCNHKKNWIKLKVKNKESFLQREKWQLLILNDSLNIKWAKQQIDIQKSLKSNNEAFTTSYLHKVKFSDQKVVSVFFREYPNDVFLENNRKKDGVVFSFNSRSKLKIHSSGKGQDLSNEKQQSALSFFKRQHLQLNNFNAKQVNKLLHLLDSMGVKYRTTDFVFHLNAMDNQLEIHYFPFDFHSEGTFFTSESVELDHFSFQNDNSDYKKYFKVVNDTLLIPLHAKTIITSLLKIPENKTLQLKDGQEIILKKGGGLLLYGNINAIGNIDNNIKVIGEEGNLGLHVFSSNKENIVEYVQFEKLSSLNFQGWSLPGAVTFYNCEVSFKNCQFNNNTSEDGLHLFLSAFSIENTSFYNCSSDALDVDFSSGKVKSLSVEKVKNDGLDLSGSEVQVHGFIANEIGDKGISAGEKTTIIGDEIIIDSALIAFASKDSSIVQFINVKIENSNLMFAVYQKKEMFGPAKLTIKGLKSTNYNEFSLVEKKSILIIDSNFYQGRISNVIKYLHELKLNDK